MKGRQRGLDLRDSLWCPNESLDLRVSVGRLGPHFVIPRQVLYLNFEGLEVVNLGRVVEFTDHRQQDFLVSSVSTAGILIQVHAD